MSNYIPTFFARETTALLRGLIARYQVSQEVIATACDMSQSQFSKVIRGVRPMTLDHFAAICDTLGHDMEEVLTEVTARITELRITASPVIFDQVGDRSPAPQPSEMTWDGWATAASKRFDVPGLVETQSDFDLAARPRATDRGEDLQ